MFPRQLHPTQRNIYNHYLRRMILKPLFEKCKKKRSYFFKQRTSDDDICIGSSLSLCPCVYMSAPYTHVTCLMDTGASAWLSLGDLSLYVSTSCHAEAETTLPRVDRSPLHRSTLLSCLKHKGNAPAWKCGSDTKPAGNQMSLRRVVELMLPLPFHLYPTKKKHNPNGYRWKNYARKSLLCPKGTLIKKNEKTSKIRMNILSI